MMRERRHRHSNRSRFVWGIVLLAFGAYALAYNLGVRIPRDFWEYWPALIMLLGLVQLAWPGSLREKVRGGWLIVIGACCWVINFEIFGLSWGTAWPILVVALGLRIVLGSLFHDDSNNTFDNTGKDEGQNNQRGAP